MIAYRCRFFVFFIPPQTSSLNYYRKCLLSVHPRPSTAVVLCVDEKSELIRRVLMGRVVCAHVSQKSGLHPELRIDYVNLFVLVASKTCVQDASNDASEANTSGFGGLHINGFG